MERKTKQTSRAKIDKMVAEGARNYPAYLKLIYTGESELSSEDEFLPPTVGRDMPSPPVASCHVLTSCFESVSTSVQQEGESPGLESTKLKDEGREKVATPYSEERARENSISNLTDLVYHKMTDCSNKQEQAADSPRAATPPSQTGGVYEEFIKLEKEKELLQIQEEIASLKSLLESKVALANQLKRKLGVTPMSELKSSIINLKQSETFLKTNAALRSLGNLASRTIGSLKLPAFRRRNSLRESCVKQSKSLSNMYEQPELATYSSSYSLKLQN